MLLKPEYVLPEFCMYVQYITKDLQDCPAETFPSKTSHHGSRNSFTTPSRRISIPSALTVRSDISDALDDFGLVDDMKKCSEGNSLFSDRESIGTLLMRNRVTNNIQNHEHETPDGRSLLNVSRMNLLSSPPIVPATVVSTGSGNCTLRNKQVIVKNVKIIRG